MGAAANAATSKESTHVHARFLDEHTEDAFDLIAEMMLGPTFPDIDSERQVVLEEIAMYEDEPSDRVHDFLAEADVRRPSARPPSAGRGDGDRRHAGAEDRRISPGPLRGGQPRGRRGRASRARRDRCARGAVSSTPPRARCPSRTADAPNREPRLRFNRKDTEQYHICFGAPGISRGDDRRFALAVIDSAFGGSVSSRLFREVREKRGLAYAVGSYAEQYLDRGSVAMYVGTREDNVAEACEIIGRELSDASRRWHLRRRA